MLKNYKFTLNNKYLLYFILILAFFDLIYLSLDRDLIYFFIYLSVGFLTSFFSSNMIVILVIAMVVTHILRMVKTRTNEGMENNDDDPVGYFEKIKSTYDLGKLPNSIEGFDDNTETNDVKTPQSSQKVVKLSKSEKVPITNNLFDNKKLSTPEMVKTKLEHIPNSSPITSKINESKNILNEIKNKRNNDKLSLTPIATPMSAPIYKDSNNDVDILSLLGSNKNEDSTNDISSLNNGISNLDIQTQKLLSTQKELMTNMENLTPLLAQAEKFIEKFKGLSQ